ncbi:unnamed protein product (macronuclear) [Paramecium tetraurelia]|uniref:Uncharacterized protein n=1 Tax=Paramecium tetraurelia TaxID=5888 RepID=A0E1I9_PARTE|nr:uncharacterized protein GSPATT00022325001 [Paramecium tetraurelia]CAK89156.1 unnamed protein product [Paramecium tetraurelia]|eukprot:XP_001456553.1 hypothetical protein (macronuclear) [Paramecium tetraurelia strain d4-2]
MGASICQQTCAINDRELVKEQVELQPKSLDSKRECSQIQDQPITDHLRINIQNSSQISYNLADQQQNQSKEYSNSNDIPEAMTPWLPWQNLLFYNKWAEQFQRRIVYSIVKHRNCLVYQIIIIISELSKCRYIANVKFSQFTFRLEFKQQQSNSSYPRFCNDDKGNKLLNMQIIEDNLDDYINYDWKNSKFQLISINDQNLLKKASSTKPKTKLQKRQF